MKTPRRPWILLAFAAAAAPALVGAAAPAGIRVEAPSVRLVPPSVTITAGFVTLVNDGAAAAALVGARSDCARVVELHVMEEREGRMSMRKVERLEIPAHGRLELGPGAAHLMLIDLRQRLEVGSPVTVHLDFADGSELAVAFPIVDPRSAGSHR